MISMIRQEVQGLKRNRPGVPVLLATLVSACSLAAHMPSLAAASATVNVQGGPSQQVIKDLRDPTLVIADTSAVSGDSSGSAYANMQTGVLRDSALATNAYPGTPYAADATSSIFDNVTFSGGVGQTAYLDWSFDGSLGYTSTSLATFGQLLVFISSSYANIMLSANPANCGAGSILANCTVGTSVSLQGSLPFVIPAGALQLGASLQAYSQFGNAAQFASTGKIYLRTPDGVSFTSASGQFLNEASPIFAQAVPEPESYALMLVGLCVVGVAARRRRT